ncbi:MAG: DNA alkylation repair protein [Acidimicrobiia bacterium]
MVTSDAVAITQRGLAAAADPDKAVPMAAYMKTEMPFYGVQKKGRIPVVREVTASCPPSDRSEYRDVVLALWCLPHREEKYVAIAYARAFDEWVDASSLPLYRRLVVEGAWWDFVDEIAIKLVGLALHKDRKQTEPQVRMWITDEDMWLRRTSVLSQIGHKEDTDTELLGEACAANLDSGEFFIRKAIGWALREYAKTDPGWVERYVEAHRETMSGLSIREATKHL